MNTKHWVKKLALISVLLITGNTNAATLSLTPSTSAIQKNGTVNLSLAITGLGNTEDLDFWNSVVDFDDSLFSFNSVSYGTSLGAPGNSFTDTIDDINFVDLTEDSNLVDFSSQADAFTLAILSFTGIAQGIGAFDVSFADFRDPSDSLISLGSSLPSANVSVSVTAVPVPGAVWLMGSALMGFVGLRRFRTPGALA